MQSLSIDLRNRVSCCRLAFEYVAQRDKSRTRWNRKIEENLAWAKV